MIKKGMKTLLEKWTGDLSNEDFGELMRALLYYEKYGYINGDELSPVVRLLMTSVFVPKMESIKKEQNRHKGYYENKKGEKE